MLLQLAAAQQRPSPLPLPLRPGGHQSDLDLVSSNLDPLVVCHAGTRQGAAVGSC